MTCHRCGDTRRITIMVPNVKRSGGVEYVSSIPAPERPEVHECPVCAEQMIIDRDKEAWEATRPNYVALSHEAIAAGNEPY